MTEGPAGARLSAGATFIGVDVGGTKVATAALSGSTLGEVRSAPTALSGERALLQQLQELIEAERAALGTAVAAVGIGMPSIVDFASGSIRASVNIPLAGVPLRQVLGERLGNIPVFVDNDATCAAIAEAHAHQDERIGSLVMLTVGTGLGGGIVIGGRPYRGATGAAGELGHTIVGLDMADAVQVSAGFPRAGSLESLASGRALDALARATAAMQPDSALGQLASSGQEVAGPQLLVAARSGDQPAADAMKLLGARLGVGIANAINTFDPEVVAIGGGVSAAGDLLLEPARESARGFIVPGAGLRTEIRMARGGGQAGVRGAALMAKLEHEEL